MSDEVLLEAFRQHLWPAYTLYYTRPLTIVRGKGSYVWDAQGRKYLDFFGGILVTAAGHGHPKILARIHEQVDRILHTSTLYIHENMVRLAKALAEKAPGGLSTSYFTNSGSEANETAIMLAKMHTGQQDIIVLRNAYSGRTTLTTNMTGNAAWRPLGSEIPGIHHAAAPYCYRCPFKSTYPECGLACAEDVENLIRTATRQGKIAAFFAEPIQGVGGFVTPPEDYFRAVADIVKRYGGLIIIDEVQTGFGRTGTYWFGIQHWGIEPDIMTMAKAMANGLPLGNTMTRPEIAASWKALTISTFGGNPVSTAAALATLEVLEEEAPPEKVEEKGRWLRAGLDALWEKYPFIGEVRGKGLMLGVELVTDRQSKEPAVKVTNAVLDAAKEAGLLIGKGGLFGNVLRIAPPLTVSEAEIHEGLEKLDRAFAQVQPMLA